MNNYILQTINLTKKFKNGIAVNKVNLNIPKGRIYGLLGPNGAGKSTTLKLITGLLYATEGNVLFDGHTFSRKDLKDFGVLIESPAFYGNLTARENIKIYIKLLNLPSSRIDEILYKVD